MRTHHAGVPTLVHNSIQRAWYLFVGAIQKKTEKENEYNQFSINNLIILARKGILGNLICLFSGMRFFPTQVNSERAFSGQEKHTLVHKLRTPKSNISENSSASKKHTLTSCFHHVCWQLSDMNFFSIEDEPDDLSICLSLLSHDNLSTVKKSWNCKDLSFLCKKLQVDQIKNFCLFLYWYDGVLLSEKDGFLNVHRPNDYIYWGNAFFS